MFRQGPRTLHHPARGAELAWVDLGAGQLPFDEVQQCFHGYSRIQKFNHLLDSEPRLFACDG